MHTITVYEYEAKKTALWELCPVLLSHKRRANYRILVYASMSLQHIKTFSMCAMQNNTSERLKFKE
jgi:hypothetical protein